jgi:hypothetical protein
MNFGHFIPLGLGAAWRRSQSEKNSLVIHAAQKLPVDIARPSLIVVRDH